MQLPADYHIHTFLCRHAEGVPESYVATAVSLGLNEIGFADHAPMPVDDFDDWRMRYSQLEEYIRLVEGVREKHSGIVVKVGLEVDYIPGYEAWIERLAKVYPWDYLIGSVHYEGEWDIDNAQKIHLWYEADVNSVWERYIELLLRALASGYFDVIGHIDLPKKFGFKPSLDLRSLYREFFVEAKRRGVVIEVNTSGLRKDCKEIYPSEELLIEAAKVGVELTFGSDAHKPEEVGWAFAEASRLVRRLGFKSWVRFAARRRECVPFSFG